MVISKMNEICLFSLTLMGDDNNFEYRRERKKLLLWPYFDLWERSTIVKIAKTYLFCFDFHCHWYTHNGRFPSMEANMEARIGNTNINKINDTNYYNGRRYSTIYTSTGNNTVLVRPNASLPRKLHTSLNRNAYYGYSHGKSPCVYIRVPSVYT